MNDLHSALDTIARRDIPETTDLWPQLAARLHERKSLMQTLRARPALAIIIVIALLLLTGVAYALGNLFGYLPGVGYVQTNSLRVLAEPASQTRQGITVTIEQVVSDSERTVVVYKAEGLSLAAANSKGEGGGPFGSRHLLRLPDGTTFNETPALGYAGTPEPLVDNLRTEGGWPNYAWRLVYPPVPAQVDELTLLIPVLQNMPAGAAPENWALTFHLKPAPADMTFAPIVTLATPSAPPGAETARPALSSLSSLNGFTFQLDNVVELPDGYVLTGSLAWDDSAFPTGKGMVISAPFGGVTLTDAGGRSIPIEAVQLDQSYADPHKTAWSYRTATKAFTGPLVLSIPSLQTSISPPPVEFDFDFGARPKMGEPHTIDRDFTVAGHAVRLLSVELAPVPDNCQGAVTRFHFTGDIPDMYANVTDTAAPAPMVCAGGSGGGGGGGAVDPLAFSMEISSKEVPTGPHHYTIDFSIPQVVEGPWQLTWNAPASSEPTPTTAPAPCLTLDKWNRLAGENASLPAGLGGKLLTNVDEGGMLPAIYIGGLDGSNLRKIGAGSWASLSADGTRLVYSTADETLIVDLAGGQSTPFRLDGYDQLWSPDGTRLMYTTTSSLFVANTDGSAVQQIDTGQAQVIAPAGWLPDNRTIVYATMGGSGFTLTTHDLQSGDTRKLFTFQNKAGFATISPDGRWVAFTDRIFGADNWGIFVSRLDGSERRQVTSEDIPTAFASVWSPDGQWLVVTVAGQDGVFASALVDPFTCQAARLDHVTGTVAGWGR